MKTRLARWVRHTRAHWWFVRAVGPISGEQYLRVQRARRRELIEGFDESVHGERMLRAVGASEEQIAVARRRGFA